ncbi:MAG: NAD-binding protein [Pseudoxanthomonas sp.]
MHLLIGLGPIGGNIVEQLAAPPRKGDGDGSGFHIHPVRDWSRPVPAPVAIDLGTVDWASVRSVHVSVPRADQVESVFESLLDSTSLPLTVFVHTTLSPNDARDILSSAPDTWRTFEAPLASGPQGPRAEAMTVLLAGPPTTAAEDRLLASISGRVFRLQSYGQPALVKLLNNALAAYNLAATANMLNLAAHHGVPPRELFEAIGVSSGRGWLSDNLADVAYENLLTDVELLAAELGPLPAVDLNDEVEPVILQARALLGNGAGA